MIRLTALALALALGAQKLNSVPLRFTPTESVAAVVNLAARAFRGKKVVVNPFTDVREDKGLIGRNSEEAQPRDVTTRDDVGGWCAARLATLLRQAGVEVVEQGGDLVVSGDITRYMVEETDRYRGTVTFRLAVSDPDGKELWSGQISGDSDRFGRSYKYDNYMETLSDALLHALAAFLGDPDLGKATR